MHFAAAVAAAMVIVADVGNCGAFLAPSSIVSTTTTRRLRRLDAPSSSSSSSSSSSIRMADGDDEDAGVLNRFSR
jgi:hypothetical protein